MRFLIVEDDPIMSMVITRLVEILGHTTVVAADGLKAMELVDKEFFDIVITDMVLPQKSGPELISYIRSKLKENITTISISSIPSVMQEDQNSNYGADLYLPKPVSLETLWFSIKKLEEKKTVFQEPSVMP